MASTLLTSCLLCLHWQKCHANLVMWGSHATKTLTQQDNYTHVRVHDCSSQCFTWHPGIQTFARCCIACLYTSEQLQARLLCHGAALLMPAASSDVH